MPIAPEADPRFCAFRDREAMNAAAIRAIGDRLRVALQLRGQALLGLSGGSTPAPIYEGLAATDLAWEKVSLVLIDDRQVPADHPASNEGMVRRTLMQKRAAAARLLPLGPTANVLAGATPAGRILDAAIFGMGLDGHTASWFPGGAGLSAALDPENPVDAVETCPDPLPTDAPFARVTLTRRFVAPTRMAILAMSGAGKKAVLGEILAPGPLALAPVRALIGDLGARLRLYWAA